MPPISKFRLFPLRPGDSNDAILKLVLHPPKILEESTVVHWSSAYFRCPLPANRIISRRRVGSQQKLIRVSSAWSYEGYSKISYRGTSCVFEFVLSGLVRSSGLGILLQFV